MKSISGKIWMEREINKNLIEKSKQDNNFSEIISKLTLSRKFDPTEIYSIENDINVSNIFRNNTDYIKSLKIVISSIQNKEKICILGDYDVDGSSATSLFVKFLKSINHNFFYYIPDREKDGYGATLELFRKLLKKKPKLIIMVDCGSTANEAINYLNKNDIKSVIIDHHEMTKPFPEANSIINPKKDNGYIEFDYFCATTLTFYFIDLLNESLGKNFKINDYLIYVLLATICDVMPLRKINRYIAKKVMKNFKFNNNKVFSKLYEILKKNENLTIDDLGFVIGPILNSGGRLGKSFYATELLSSSNNKNIDITSRKLIDLNEKRKNIEYKILNEISFNEIEKKNESIILIYDPNINEGLIGIIAARVKDYFNKPTIIITTSNDYLKASARSIPGFNIGILIKNLIHNNILIKGGGHQMAGGFTLKKNKLNELKKFINLQCKKNNLNNKNQLYYDSIVSASAFNINFFNEIKKLSPFGNGNTEPFFLFQNLKILKPKIIKEKHIFCIFKSINNKSINALSFNAIDTKTGEYLMNYKNEINVIAQIKENFWNNKYNLQLIVKDIII
jgi:single-stranded-DNA-specific exonuclease